jgi:DNA polymerase I-like protein with 3'-5' exonuclease and polymerase domains
MLPNLSAAKSVGIDLETKDDGLAADKGPSWPWGSGYIVGIGVSADNDSWYFPIRHQGGDNLDPSLVIGWVRDLLRRNIDKYFHNAGYDLGWLHHEGIDEIGGKIHCTQIMASLLDEERRSYSLDSVAMDELGESKDETLLKEAAAAYGIHPKSGLWRLPGRLVGPYGAQDPLITARLAAKLMPRLAAEGLGPLYDLESNLIRVYHEMTRVGLLIDEDNLAQAIDHVEKKALELQKELDRRCGFAVNVNSNDHLERAFNEEGVWFPSTKKGNSSFTKLWLEGHEHWLPKSITNVRTWTRYASTFLVGHFQENLHNSRLYPSIHGLRSDKGGTITGRLSYSHPPLQQTPSRDNELAPLIRNIFLPEHGLWGSYDYKQQEPYLVVHYAELLEVKGGAEAGEWLRTADKPDFHQMFADLVGRKREKLTKDMYQGISYGIGKDKLAATLGVSVEQAQDYKDIVKEKVPFLEALAEKCSRRAAQNGFIRTILRRRGRFPYWEPANWGDRTGEKLRLDEAQKRWPGARLIRYKLHKAMNKLIQGSAADQMKQAMWRIHEAGYHMSIQMHDELGISTDNVKQRDEIVEIMEHAVELLVPVGVDAEFGPTWGKAKQTWEEANA